MDSARRHTFNLLLVDDELHFCRLVMDILALSDCRLNYYTDPHEGLREAMIRRDLDLIILDIEMPELSGLDILRQLKKSHNRRVPVMMFTAHAEMSVVRQALELGAQEYLLKPFSAKALIARIQHLLQAPIFSAMSVPNHAVNSATLQPLSSEQAPLILLVDHDTAAIQLIQDMLNGSICRLVSTQNPQEGLDMVSRQEPALILLNAHMPEGGGLAFLHALRTTLNKQIPVILLIDPSENGLSAFSAYQPQGYLSKPYRFHQLISQIESILKRSLFPGRL